MILANIYILFGATDDLVVHPPDLLCVPQAGLFVVRRERFPSFWCETEVPNRENRSATRPFNRSGGPEMEGELPF